MCVCVCVCVCEREREREREFLCVYIYACCVRVFASILPCILARQLLLVSFMHSPQAKNYDLTTADHVWILPAYYNPDWWKSPPLIRNNDCSDEEMLDILNKLVIFIDGVKYPSIVSKKYFRIAF